MKPIYIYAIFYLLGIISGIFFWEKWSVNTIFKGKVRLTQRGEGHTMSTNIKTEITPRMKRKQERQEAKDAKKQGKVIKRNAKKQRKAEKRLDI